MTQIPIGEAISNFQTYFNFFGLNPGWVQGENTDTKFFILGLFLVGIAFAIGWFWPSTGNKGPKFEILFEQGKEPFLWSSSQEYICRFGIVNSGDMTLNDLQVKLHEINPHPDKTIFGSPLVLPCYLRFQHDEGVLLERYFRYKTHETLHPKDKMFINVCYCLKRISDSVDNVEILTTNSSDYLRLHSRAYEFKILVSSENGGSKFLDFRYDPEQEDEKNVWVQATKFL